MFIFFKTKKKQKNHKTYKTFTSLKKVFKKKPTIEMNRFIAPTSFNNFYTSTFTKFGLPTFPSFEYNEGDPNFKVIIYDYKNNLFRNRINQIL